MADVLGYTGRRVVVTGCASGIGRQTARRLIELGARVHGLDRAACDLDLAAFTAVDLGEPQSIAAAAGAIAGPVDGLFNCAGVAPSQAHLQVIRVNFLGPRRLTEALLHQMPPGAAIVNISSVGGSAWPERLAALAEFVSTPSFEAGVAWCEAHAGLIADGYRFSKEAHVVWTMQASAPLIARGVRINCTSPGAVQTPMLDEIEAVTSAAPIDAVAQPIGRRSTPDEQVWPLLFLGSPVASYVTGVDLPVDGGFKAQRTLAGS
jgi:NAD(P)-dependent dehydrogenase (short-subunit alcohol dehydrogenase family)